MRLHKSLTIPFVGLLALVMTACNLQQAPLNPTPTLLPTPTAFSELPGQPTRTPINLPPTQVDLNTPPLPAFETPTALPLGSSPVAVTAASGTVIPTVSTQQAVKSTTIQVTAGKTVGLNYVLTMTMGSVTLTMQGSGGVVWQKTFTASETGRIEVVIPQAGAYDVMAQTDHFEGNYQLSWD